MITRCFTAWTAVVAALVCSLLTAPTSANAASGDRIGDAIVIINTVKADARKLATGDDVRQDETIEVNGDSQGEFKLQDDTKLALGPGSRLVLDKFVYDSDKKTGTVVINLAKGAFRFITGVAAKPSYVIKTPNASITVRGTIFDLFVLPDRNVWVLLHEGAIEATGTNNNVCHVLDQPGRLMRISSTGRVSPAANWSKMPGNADVPFDTAFPFVVKAPQIDSTPIMSREEIMEASFPDVPEKPCINPVPATPNKIRKADDDGDSPKPKKRKVVKEADDDPPAKPTKTAKRPPRNDDDDCANCVTGMDIVIGGGMGGFGGGRHRMPGRMRGN